MHSRIPLFCAALVLAAVCAPAQPPPAGLEFKVYSLGFVDPDVAAAAAQALAGEPGRAILDRPGGRMLLNATPEAHEQFADLLRQLNVPPANVRIEVEFADRTEASAFDAGLGAEGGGILRDGEAEGRGRIRGTLDARDSRSRETVRQTLLVASGREASLAVGEEVPNLVWINECGRHWGLYPAELRWQQVGAFLVVQPTVLPDGHTLRIRLIPELSGRVDGQPCRVRYTRAATELIAVDGRPVTLAAHGEQRDFYERFLIGTRRAGTHHAVDVRMTPTILPPPAPPPPAGPVQP